MPPRPVKVLEISETTNKETKTFTGIIQSSKQATLAFRVPGLIQEIQVEEGQKVKKGDVLGLLDPYDYELSVIMISAKLSEAEAANKIAKAAYQRIQKASLSNAVATIQLEKAESDLERSVAVIKALKQNLKQAENALNHTRLTAPFNGIVGKIHMDAYEQVTSGVPVIELHQPEKLEAVIDVPERLVSMFIKGQTGTLSYHGSDKKIQVTVCEISSVAHPASRTYSVTFEIPERENELIPGKPVTVNVPFDHPDDFVCIPYEALLQKGDMASVFIIEDQKVVRRPVQISRFMDKNVCIRSDLKPEDALVVAGLHFLKNGQTVGRLIPVE